MKIDKAIILDSISEYIELTVSEPIKQINELGRQFGVIGMKNARPKQSVLRIAKSQQISPEIKYKIRQDGPLVTPRISLMP